MNCKNGNELIEVSPGKRYLFIDDFCIEGMEDLKRTMHQPVKKGAVIRPDPSGGCLQTRCAPVWDDEDNVYKILLIGDGATFYAESTDGLHWTKPDLYQKEINGTFRNNCVTVDQELEWPQSGIINMIYDPDESDTTRRFKALSYCTEKSSKLNFDHQPLISPDCKKWERLNVPLIPSQDESNMSYDRKTRTFIATVKHGGPNGRSVFLSTSKDFENWTKPELIFHSDDEDQIRGRKIIEAYVSDVMMQPSFFHPTDPGKYNVDVYNMGLFEYEDIYIGMPAMFHSIGPVSNYPNTYGFHIIQLAASRDMKRWDRLGDRQAFIAPSLKGAGAYDLTQLLPPSSPVIREDELWFYYTGTKYRGEYDYKGKYPDGEITPFAENEKDSGAICLAVLRRDGFISLDGAKEEGSLMTKAIKLDGKKLKVNVDAAGLLEVTLFDMEGKVLAESMPVKGDKLCECVEWKTAGIEKFKDRKVKMRFRVIDSSFYSFWFED